LNSTGRIHAGRGTADKTGRTGIPAESTVIGIRAEIIAEPVRTGSHLGRAAFFDRDLICIITDHGARVPQFVNKKTGITERGYAGILVADKTDRAPVPAGTTIGGIGLQVMAVIVRTGSHVLRAPVIGSFRNGSVFSSQSRHQYAL
jgi:hypothetical protein